MKRKFEDLLQLIGSFGRYQKKLFFFVLIPNSFFVALTLNITYFQAIVPDYWCNVPGRDNTKYSIEEWKNITIPKNQNGVFERCTKRKIQWDQSTDDFHIQNQTEDCIYGWNHDESIFKETIATDNEWLCGKEIYSTHILSIYMAGNSVGTLILPIIVDKITGRRLMFFILSGFHAVTILFLLFAPTFKLHLAFRFLSGLVYHVNFQMPYIIILELMSPEKRALAGTVAFLSWTVAMCATSLIAYCISHWWYLALISAIPSILSFGFWKILPESPRWLLSKGRYDECTKLLLKVAEENDQTVSAEIIEKDLRAITDNDTNVEFTNICKYPRIIRNAVVLFFTAFTIWISYGCITLNMNILPNNYFLNYFILSLMEFPSNLSCYFGMNYLGRKLSMVLTFLLSSVMTAIAIFTLKNRVVLMLVISILKILVTQGVLIMYVIVGEIFPTPIRSIGFGLVLVAACFGMMTSPYVINEGELFQYLTVMTLSLVVVVLFLQIPETLGESLPQTFNEAEVLGKDQSLIKLPKQFWTRSKKNCNLTENSANVIS